MASKRHHYVPIFYLNYFVNKHTDGTRRFWVYDKGGGPARIQTPINTAVEGHLYSFETSSGDTDDSLERLLSKLETETKPVLDRWQLPSVAPTEDEKNLIAEFLALMHTRSPRTIQGIMEASQTIGIEVARFVADRPQMVREFLEQERLSGRSNIPSVDEMIDILRSVEKRFEIKVNRKNSLVESLKLSERVATELFKMNWCLCRAPTGAFFVKSDTPLCTFAETGHDRALLGAGFGRPNAEVTFPISPSVCLFLDRYHEKGRMAVGKQFVREANNRMAAIAERLVISAYRSDTVAALVTKYSFTRGLPKVDRSTFGRTFQQRLKARAAKNVGIK